MKANHTPSKGVRLIDIPYLPADQALAMLARMPEYLGEAVAKLCYNQINQQR